MSDERKMADLSYDSAMKITPSSSDSENQRFASALRALHYRYRTSSE